MMNYNNNNNNNHANNLNNINNFYKLHKWIDINKLSWYNLSSNPNAIYLLEKNIDKINWTNLSGNPSIFTYDYEKMKNHNMINGFSSELSMTVFHPGRLQHICDKYNIDFDELNALY